MRTIMGVVGFLMVTTALLRGAYLEFNLTRVNRELSKSQDLVTACVRDDVENRLTAGWYEYECNQHGDECHLESWKKAHPMPHRSGESK